MNLPIEIYKTTLDELLTQPVALQPIFNAITGNTTAAILLSQMLFWERSRTCSPSVRKTFVEADGREYGYWYHKTSQFEAELYLTKRQIQEARRRLRELAILKEGYAGIPAKMYYRVDVERIAYLVHAFRNGIEVERGTGDWKESLAVTKRDPKGLQSVTPSGNTGGNASGNITANTLETNEETNKETNTSSSAAIATEGEGADEYDSLIAEFLEQCEEAIASHQNLPGKGKQSPAAQKAPRKNPLEANTEHFRILRALLAHCRNVTTPEERANLRKGTPEQVGNEVKLLRETTGATADQVEAFVAWWNRKYGAERDGLIGWGHIRDNWPLFSKSQLTPDGKVKTAQSGHRIEVSPDGRTVSIINSETGTVMRRMSQSDYALAFPGGAK